MISTQGKRNEGIVDTKKAICFTKFNTYIEIEHGLGSVCTYKWIKLT